MAIHFPSPYPCTAFLRSTPYFSFTSYFLSPSYFSAECARPNPNACITEAFLPFSNSFVSLSSCRVCLRCGPTLLMQFSFMHVIAFAEALYLNSFHPPKQRTETHLHHHHYHHQYHHHHHDHYHKHGRTHCLHLY